MLFPVDIETQIGFDRIRQKIATYCHGAYSLEMAEKIVFSNNIGTIERRLDETSEMVYIMRFEGGLPPQEYTDIRSELLRITTQGAVIEIDALFLLGIILRGITELTDFFKERSEKFINLGGLSSNVPHVKNWVDIIMSVLNEKGEMRDSASSELLNIRQSIIKKRKDVDRLILSMMIRFKKEGLVSEDSEISLRNHRLVIPFPASAKRRIRGVIHDESATGQTVYIEPLEVFDLNNDIQELESDEKREIRKILSNISDSLRPSLHDIFSALEFLAHIDLTQALAKLAIDLDAIKPAISEKSGIELHQARHPLLVYSFKENNRKVIPLSLTLESDKRVLIISGPNAGGKSVALKTAGLLQYMFQCGLLIPALEVSRCGIFDSIFADIGDQQSIENDISTYSGHLMNMRVFLQNANNRTLVLLDELGSGTEPESGGAIAEAILENLVAAEVFGIITTHYFNLKMFANRTPGVVNAAMLYDRKLLMPTYILRSGNPGSSFALEIARNTGIPKNIIEKATSMIGNSKVKAEEWIQDIETEKEQLYQRQQQLEIAEQFVTELVEKYSDLNEKIRSRRDKIIDDAKNEAIQIIENARKLVENAISDIKTFNAEKEKTRDIRLQLENEKQRLNAPVPERIAEKFPLRKEKGVAIEKQSNEIGGLAMAGDQVRMIGSDQVGDVILVSSNSALVLFGNVQVRVALNQLVRIKVHTDGKRQGKKIKDSMVISELPFSLTLDLRGKRAEEALPEVERFVDQALIKRVSRIYILHGRGEGILRKIIRQYLNGLKDILSYEDEHPERGGDGVTVIEFNRG